MDDVVLMRAEEAVEEAAAEAGWSKKNKKKNTWQCGEKSCPTFLLVAEFPSIDHSQGFIFQYPVQCQFPLDLRNPSHGLPSNHLFKTPFHLP